MSGNKPIARFKSPVAYGVELTAWKGKNGPTFTIRKSAKDKQTGEYKEYTSFFPGDLAGLQHCINMALSDQKLYQREANSDTPEQTGFEGYQDTAGGTTGTSSNQASGLDEPMPF